MIKEIDDKDKLLKLKSTLDEFLDNDDCGGVFDCRSCPYKRVCDYMYRLNSIINLRYLK